MKLSQQEIEEALAHLDECEPNHELEEYRYELERLSSECGDYHISDES